MVNSHIESDIMKLLSGISDPEIPVVSIIEMGMVRGVEIRNDLVIVTITPTYSGCPAMHQIESDIQQSLLENGFENSVVQTKLSPPWTTDLMSDNTKFKLKQYGIAPPVGNSKDIRMDLFPIMSKILCPFCDSEKTELKSEFGSTACKSYYFCNSCNQNFEYFKCH